MNANLPMPSAKGLLYKIRYEKTSNRDIVKKPFGLSNKGESTERLKDDFHSSGILLPFP
jgi:hypothetical protein